LFQEGFAISGKEFRSRQSVGRWAGAAGLRSRAATFRAASLDKKNGRRRGDGQGWGRPGGARKAAVPQFLLSHLGPPRFVPGGPSAFRTPSVNYDTQRCANRLTLPGVFSLDWDPSPMAGPFLRSAVRRPRVAPASPSGVRFILNACPALRKPPNQTCAGGLPRVVRGAIQAETTV
jgi:hypothetical protein